MEQLVTWVERRMALSSDDEITRQQYVVSFVPVVFSTLLALAWTILFFTAGLPALGIIHAVYTFCCVLATLGGLLWPRRALVFGTALCLIGIGINLLAHVAVGGFDGGMWHLLWLVILPVTAYFSGGNRPLSVLILVSAVLCLGVALAIDARLAPPPLIPHWLRLLYNGFVLLAGMGLLFLWSVYILQELNSARREADGLLLNVLPEAIARQLKRNPAAIAQAYDGVTVLFADIVDFTPLSATADPAVVVGFLNDLFSDFDELALRHGLEKIKTIGDAYMVAGGLPMPRPDHCEQVVAFALEMQEAARRRAAWNGQTVQLRIGINTGPVVAGVIGRHKFIYDLWGDAVNTASRMEAYGQAGAIQVTQAVRDCLADRYEFEARPPVRIKGKGEMVTYFLKGPRPAADHRPLPAND